MKIIVNNHLTNSESIVEVDDKEVLEKVFDSPSLYFLIRVKLGELYTGIPHPLHKNEPISKSWCEFAVYRNDEDTLVFSVNNRVAGEVTLKNVPNYQTAWKVSR